MKYFLILIALVVVGFSQPTYAQQDSILSDSYITSQEKVDATVIRVSPRNRTLTVRGNNNGQTRQFTVAEGIRVSVNGRQARLRDIRRGDNIQLVMKAKSNKVVVDRIDVPLTPVTLEQRRAAPIAQEAAPMMLPKTAGTWSTALLLGSLALIGAMIIRRRRFTS